MQSRRELLRALLSSAAAVIAVQASSTEVYSENAVKAAFLYRFAGYITWPSEMPAATTFGIAVLGAEAVAQELERVLAGRTIAGRPARVQRIRSIRELDDAQMLYVASGSIERLQGEIASIASKPVLVVTDMPGGLETGSTVNFMLVDRRVRFEISLAAAERARLKISAELLSVAARVEGEPRRSELACTPVSSQERCRPVRLAAG